MRYKKSFGLVVLASLLCLAWITAAGLLPVPVAVAQTSPLPPPDSPLPLPPPAPSSQTGGGNGGHFAANAAIELPSPGSAGQLAMRIKTQQVSVGWWDACGHLHLALASTGYADIPAAAVEISIPGDVTGQFALADWTKTQRANGEWVLRRNVITQICE